MVSELVSTLSKIGLNMSLKIHRFYSYLDYFDNNMGDVSDEHGERFHQELVSFEKRYQNQVTCNMLADYIWMIAILKVKSISKAYR